MKEIRPEDEERSFYKRLGPWVGAGIILAILFWRIDLQQFFEAMRQADIHIYLPLMMVFVLFWFLGESQNLAALFKYFNHRIPFGEVLTIRGVTYLLMTINYNLGLGGIALYLNRTHNIPLLRTTSLMLFYMLSETVSLSLMAALGCLFARESSRLLGNILLGCVCILLVCVAGILIFRLMPAKGILQKVKGIGLFKTFDEAGLRSYILLPFWRGLYFASFILFFYFAVKAFHMDIPLLILAAFVPIIFFVSNLPVTPSGLGTIQAAMLFFFKDYGSQANILAFSITYSTTLLLLRVPIGLCYLRKGDFSAI